jgi:hypothetical protein
MEPVISPWLVYLIMQVNSWNFALGSIGLIGTPLVLIISFMVGVIPCDEKERGGKSCGGCETSCMTNALKIFMYGFPFPCLCLLLWLVVPSKEGLIAIIAATYATPDNLQLGADAAMSVKEMVKADIVDVLTAITNTTQ